jgi:hypothetical protein
MNVWKTIVVAGATLALAAPAGASLDRVLPANGPHAKAGKVTKITHRQKGGKTKIGTGKTKVGTGSSGGRVIVIVGKPLPYSAPSTVDECSYSGNDCTDQQLCDIWGMNCNLVESIPAAVAASPDPAPAPAPAPEATPAPMSDVASDASSGTTGDWNGESTVYAPVDEYLDC